MKKNIIKKTGYLFLLVALLLTACGAPKSVEQQVTENLLGVETEAIPETENQEEDAPAVTEEPLEETPEDTVIIPEETEETEIDYEAPTESGAVTAEVIEDVITDDKLQLVFLGDSIFDQNRDGTGVPYLTAQACDAHVYNLAIGGTTASLDWYGEAAYEEWDDNCLIGIAHAICGNVDPGFMEKYYAKDVFDKCNFENTDYFIIEYGINDFLSKRPITREDQTLQDVRYYYNAVCQAISQLLSTYPNATVIFCTPHYCNFVNSPVGTGDCNMLNNGYGTLYNYISAGHNAAQRAGAIAINCYDKLGIDGYTLDEMTIDGIHLSEAGRRLYADMLTEIILKNEETRNN